VLQYEMERVDDVRLRDIPYDKKRLALEIDIAVIKLEREIALGLWTPKGLRKDVFKETLLGRSVRLGDVKETNANEFNAWHDHRTAWFICYFAFYGTCFDVAHSSYRTKVVIKERREALKRQTSILHRIDGNEKVLNWEDVKVLDEKLDTKNEDLRQHGEALKIKRKQAKGCHTFEIERVCIPGKNRSVDDAEVETKSFESLKLFRTDELRELLTLNNISIGVDTSREQMEQILRKEVGKNNVKTFKLELRDERLRDAVEELLPVQVLVKGKLKQVLTLNAAERAEVLSRYQLKSSGNRVEDVAQINAKKLHIRDQLQRVDKIIERLESEAKGSERAEETDGRSNRLLSDAEEDGEEEEEDFFSEEE